MAEATLTTRVKVRPVLRFCRICCPSCECVQGAAVTYTADGVAVYDVACKYCDYWITDDEWDEVHDELV